MNSQPKILILVLIVLLLITSACKEEKSSDDSSSVDKNLPARLQEIQKKDKLVVGTAITRPFEYRDENGKLVGFDVDLMNKIADELGVEVEWREMAFADLLTTLSSGNVDVVIASMYIRPDREEIVDMSQPYLDAGLVMVVQVDNTSVETLEDLEGKTVAVKEGSTGQNYAEKLIDEQDIALEMLIYTDTIESLDDLRDGKVDVVFNDYNNSLIYIQNNPGVRVQGEIFDPAGLGISVKTDDTDLLNFINNTLTELEESGEIQKMFDKWINPETAG